MLINSPVCQFFILWQTGIVDSRESIVFSQNKKSSFRAAGLQDWLVLFEFIAFVSKVLPAKLLTCIPATDYRLPAIDCLLPTDFPIFATSKNKFLA